MSQPMTWPIRFDGRRYCICDVALSDGGGKTNDAHNGDKIQRCEQENYSGVGRGPGHAFHLRAGIFAGQQGRILGTVTDQSGGVIAGATVTVTDIQRGVSRALTTDDAGEYSAPQLLPGTYKVRAESKGFSAIERTDLLLETGKEIRVDLTLSPGQQTQTITVTEQLPVVETTNATLGGTLSNQTINDLPLNGRNYQNLLSLRPGVLAEPGGGSWTQSTNGVRPEDNVFLVNGMLNVGAFSALSIMNAPALAGRCGFDFAD